jgi:hypothetical protein
MDLKFHNCRFFRGIILLDPAIFTISTEAKDLTDIRKVESLARYIWVLVNGRHRRFPGRYFLAVDVAARRRRLWLLVHIHEQWQKKNFWEDVCYERDGWDV